MRRRHQPGILARGADSGAIRQDDMRDTRGIAGATLLYGPNDPVPDLVPVMQFLVDDLRADGRRISGLRLSSRSLRLRADEFEFALTMAEGPLPSYTLSGLMRLVPPADSPPDLARARLLRGLHRHRHALGFLLRRRGAPDADFEQAAQALTQLGRLSLLPVIEAAPPALLIWQPGALLFSLSEFLTSDSAVLLNPPDRQTQSLIAAGAHRVAQRPATLGARQNPAHPARASRAERAEHRSAGRIFGATAPDYVRALPQLEAAKERLDDALRQSCVPQSCVPQSCAPQFRAPQFRARRAQIAAVLALWGVLLPRLLG